MSFGTGVLLAEIGGVAVDMVVALPVSIVIIIGAVRLT